VPQGTKSISKAFRVHSGRNVACHLIERRFCRSEPRRPNSVCAPTVRPQLSGPVLSGSSSPSNYYRERAGNIPGHNYEALTGSWTAITSDRHPNPIQPRFPSNHQLPKWLTPRRMGCLPVMEQTFQTPVSRPLELLFSKFDATMHRRVTSTSFCHVA